jgi:hypothetical protein
MSVRVMSWVWANGPADQGELLVMLALADFCNDDGECWPAMASVARKARLTERGVRKIVRRLEDRGLLSVSIGGGRSSCNLYRINTENPEHQTRNPVPPEPRSPGTREHKPGTRVQETRNPGSAEPSRTIKEPSVSLIRASDEVREVLEEVATPAAVTSFLAYRRKSKAGALTPTGARRLAASLREIFDSGGDTDDALAMAEERGWRSIKPDWYFKEAGNGQPHHNRNDPALRAIAAAARAF